MDQHRIDELYFKIIGCKQAHQRDLKRMWKNCKRIQDEISKESVACRRSGKNTPKMQALLQELETSVDNLEQYLVFATLLNS
jgi:hypothetical protein